MEPSELLRSCREHLANTDIYLLDLILRGLLAPPARVLDAGCGTGRNLTALSALGFDAVGMDHAIPTLRRHKPGTAGAALLASGSLQDLPFYNECFDAVIANAVLHFAPTPVNFDTMISELWRVLRPGGLFFARLAVCDGLETQIRPLPNGWYDLPDGSERFLTTLAHLDTKTQKLGAEYVTPLKTALVHGQRSMATWCVRKPMQKPELPI